MSQIRISRTSIDEVERALKDYETLLSQLQAAGTIKEQTHETYSRYAEMFVRWMKGEFNPGARNKS